MVYFILKNKGKTIIQKLLLAPLYFLVWDKMTSLIHVYNFTKKLQLEQFSSIIYDRNDLLCNKVDDTSSYMNIHIYQLEFKGTQ